jgi:SP family arabinose:H+ symporter-like MFS transporter
MAFIVTKFYPPLADLVGNYYTFWGFAGLLVIALILIIIFVPETKGRSLEEIQQLFRSSDEQDPILDNPPPYEQNSKRRH